MPVSYSDNKISKVPKGRHIIAGDGSHRNAVRRDRYSPEGTTCHVNRLHVVPSGLVKSIFNSDPVTHVTGYYISSLRDFVGQDARPTLPDPSAVRLLDSVCS